MKRVSRMHRALLTLAAAVLLAVLLLSSHAAGAHVRRDLVVSAAASLTDAFRDIEPAFEAEYPDVDVLMNFASSGALYRQIAQGAPVDVYAAASPRWMRTAMDNGFVAPNDVRIFARNTLVLAVPAGNPAGVASVGDLSARRVRSIAIGTPETVPAGQYARSSLVALKAYDALLPKLIFCDHVRQALDYLVSGSVDAGFVYRTDAVKGGDEVAVVAEMPLQQAVAYPLAMLSASGHRKAAGAFVAFVTGKTGRALLRGQGFATP